MTTSPAAPPFKRARWLLSPHLETIAAVFNKHPQVQYTREIINTRENDEIAMDYARGTPDSPLLVLFHGLEGCSQSRTLRCLARGFIDKGWTVAVPHFRGCGGHVNRLPRAYHAADAEDVEWMIAYCRAYFPHRHCYAVGVSLGGSALIHFLARRTFNAPAATVSTPFDLAACVEQLDHGINRRIYVRHFLKTLRAKVIDKSLRYPAICDIPRLKKAVTMSEFDELYTAPVHGFRNARLYWHQASTAKLLEELASPLLCINALNDPLIPADTLPPPSKNPLVQFCRPQQGGHGAFMGMPSDWLFQTVYNFLIQQSPSS